ncbi:hypothetical protein BHE83_20540 [Xanthomonas euvesicatoria pv. vesicatoria str. 85-10]|nr:hypothetical protein BHE83_20540 [Xanthomonas euvesicatoria pv. vesicatoria str. 85-10]
MDAIGFNISRGLSLERKTLPLNFDIITFIPPRSHLSRSVMNLLNALQSIFEFILRERLAGKSVMDSNNVTEIICNILRK